MNTEGGLSSSFSHSIRYPSTQKNGNVYIFVIRNTRVLFRQLEELYVPPKKSSIFRSYHSFSQSLKYYPVVPAKYRYKTSFYFSKHVYSYRMKFSFQARTFLYLGQNKDFLSFHNDQKSCKCCMLH